MSWFGCLFGHSFGMLNDGYQYCGMCGVARAAPCSHEFKIIETYNEKWAGRMIAKMYILQCKKCGVLKSEKYE